MGSRATHLKAGMGGFERRALRRGDVLPLGPGRTPDRQARAGARRALTAPHLPVSTPAVLRAIPGPEPAPAAFWETVFTISAQSDRMGFRLDGPSMDAPGDHLSSPIAMGTVQATPSGTCVLLMADRATSGGYARVATVITADLPIAGQLAPGDRLSFAPVTLADARSALASMRAALPDLAS
jgi:antagonist of KipI